MSSTSDPEERNNLADENTDIVQSLAALAKEYKKKIIAKVEPAEDKRGWPSK